MRAVMIVVAIVGALVASAQRPERNSFLNEKALSVAAVIHQFDTDPEVRDRFRRHYAMSDEEIRSYFASLRLAKVKNPGAFRVFGVADNGVIHATTQKLRKGAVVLVEVDGTLAMRMYCGNPMTLGPADVTAPNDMDTELIDRTTVSVRELELPEQMSSAEFGPNEEMIPTVGPVPDHPLPTTTTPTTTETGGEGPADLTGGPALNPLAFLPLFFVATPVHHGKTPIPEPASVVAVSLGLAGLVLRRRRG